MVECTDEAIRGWDKRLNEVYQQVMTDLDPKSQELLRASQRRWVAFREAEHQAMGGPWRQDRGTIIRVLTVNADLSAIKERVQELQLYGSDSGCRPRQARAAGGVIREGRRASGALVSGVRKADGTTAMVWPVALA